MLNYGGHSMLKPLPARPRLSPLATNRIALVASNYNGEFVEPMIAHALEEIRSIEPDSQAEVFRAPGSFEIPFLARQVITRRKPDVVICLGVLFQGESGHAQLIASAVSDCLCMLSTDTMTPVIHAVLLLKDEDQARERCLGDTVNRGTEAARAAIEILRTSRSISQQ